MTQIYQVKAGNMLCGRLYVHQTGLHTYIPAGQFRPIVRNTGPLEAVLKYKRLNLVRVH